MPYKDNFRKDEPLGVAMLEITPPKTFHNCLKGLHGLHGVNLKLKSWCDCLVYCYGGSILYMEAVPYREELLRLAGLLPTHGPSSCGYQSGP